MSTWRDRLLAGEFESDEIRDSTGEVYMRRYFLDASHDIRFHHILLSDVDRDLHDHPWDFVSLILEGTYLETTEHGIEQYSAGDLLIRSAETLHRLTLPEGQVWTYVTTGPVLRNWGFMTEYGWMDHAQYFNWRNGNGRSWF
jgi:hypothetical protein